MRFTDAYSPSDEELRRWAYEADLDEPAADWELILCWGMDRARLRTCVELADDLNCPAADFLLLVLYQWVDRVAKLSDFELWRPEYGGYLEEAQGAGRPEVRRWRWRARLFFQGTAALDRAAWWRFYAEDP